MNNDRFCQFIRNLQARDENGDNIRSANRVIEIGRECISFLFFVQSFNHKSNLIGSDYSCQIKVEKKNNSIKVEGGRTIKTDHNYHHFSLPNPVGTRRRKPISVTASRKMLEVIRENKDPFKRQRDMCLYELLEQTGGRIGEISLITIEDIREANSSDENAPSLKLTTLKRQDRKSIRYVPVPRLVIDNLMSLVRNRRCVIRKKIQSTTCSLSSDHGYLFANVHTGKAMSRNSLSNLVAEWRIKSGIQEMGHAHLFRHAYITATLKRMLLQADIETKDQLRKSLLDINKLKQELQQWTGHTNISSLDPYIDLVFSDISGIKKIVRKLNIEPSFQIFDRTLEQIITDMEDGLITKSEAALKMRQCAISFKKDRVVN